MVGATGFLAGGEPAGGGESATSRGQKNTPEKPQFFKGQKAIGHPGQDEEILSAIVSPLARPSPFAPDLPPLRGLAFPPLGRASPHAAAFPP